MHPVSCFITLTYDDDHYSPSLNYLDFQRFMYRVRSRLGKTRFFMCGEYGDVNLRPHFHALLFGQYFSDGVSCGKSIFSSAVLSSLWPFGFSSFGAVSYQSAAYVAGYCFKKLSGNYVRSTVVDMRTGELVPRVSEFGHMSLKPGIGYDWFRKFWREVYGVRDGCVLKGGQLVPAPRYYDKLLERLDPDLAESQFYSRYVNAERFLQDTTPARLAVRETCAKAHYDSKQRSL
jgi:hypothetical protein